VGSEEGKESVEEKGSEVEKENVVHEVRVDQMDHGVHGRKVETVFLVLLHIVYIFLVLDFFLTYITAFFLLFLVLLIFELVHHICGILDLEEVPFLFHKMSILA
jgi:hypothetical protein